MNRDHARVAPLRVAGEQRLDLGLDAEATQLVPVELEQQSLIVDNAEKHKRNPEFIDDAISTIAGSVGRMKRIMQQLKSISNHKKTGSSPS